MLFKEELAQKILTGEKTQTRRPIKPGEQLVERDGLKTVLTAGGRVKYQVGRDYAVQYGRGKPCRWYGPSYLLSWDAYQFNVEQNGEYAETIFRQSGFRPMRIVVTDIREEDVREINLHDSIQEGFFDEINFLETWCEFYDLTALNHPYWFEKYRLEARPDHLYQGFAYTFELVEVL